MNFFIRFTTHFLALVIAVNCLGISYADSTKVDTVSPANINDICKLSIKAIQNPKNPSLVFFQIDLKNVNDRKLIFPLSRPLKDYRFTVKDEAGNSVPLTQYGISALKARLFSNRLDSLEPGMSSSVQFPFSWVFDLTKGGAFSITASRRVFPVYGEKSVEVDSDPVLLKIPVAPLSVSSVAQQTQINTSIDSVIPPAHNMASRR